MVSCATTVRFSPRSATLRPGTSSVTTYRSCVSRPRKREVLSYAVPTPPSPETRTVRTVPGSQSFVVVKSDRYSATRLTGRSTRTTRLSVIMGATYPSPA